MNEGFSNRARRIFRSPFPWAFLAGAILLVLIRPLLRFEPAPPPPLWTLPRFTLTDQDGRPFGSDELRGRVYVASFFFARCASICPALMQAMSRLQERYAAAGMSEVRLVSISVDPAADTPEVLREHGSRYGQDRSRWTLLTGDAEAVAKLLREGFRVPVGEREDLGGGLFDIAHSAKLALVDGEGRVRGFYDATEPGLDEIFHRTRHVLRERGG